MAVSKKTITDVADDVAGGATRAAKKAGGKASDILVDVTGEVADITDKAGDAARSAAATGKGYAADAVHGIAKAAREMADRLAQGKPDGESGKTADFARRAADGMESFSARLREKDMAEITEEARDAVRRNPAVAVGAAAVIGFALARFLKGGDEA